MRIPLAILLVLLLALPAAAKKPVRKSAGRSYSDQELMNIEKAAFAGVNAQRSQHGLPALAWNEAVAGVCREYAMSMATQGFFGHDDPQGRQPGDRATEAGISFLRYGENIIKVDHPTESVDQLARTAVTGWMGSPKHRVNVLQKDFREAGMGVVQGADKRVYFVQNFLLAGAQLFPPPVRRNDAGNIATQVEAGLRAIHSSGSRPSDIGSLRRKLANTLRDHTVVPGITITDKTTGQGYFVDLIVDACVLVAIVPGQASLQGKASTLAPLVKGRSTFQSLIVCSVSPIAWARVDEKSGGGPGAGSKIPTTSSGKVDGRKILRDLLKKI